jgi:hypothetical protein
MAGSTTFFFAMLTASHELVDGVNYLDEPDDDT